MDKFRIDSHKLMYHVPRLHDWLDGKLVYPIYMETSPAGGCNHRCRFCALDFMKYRPRFLDWPIFRERISELGRLGLKSMMHAGEGEPLLHEHIADMVRHGKASGIDQSLTTNGVLLTPELAREMLPHCEWIKVSINAGTRDTYAYLHRTQPEDFDAVLANMAKADCIRKAQNHACTLGMQILLLPENREEIEELARAARDCGMDYLVVKPYSQHPSSHTTAYQDVRYAQDLALADTLKQYNTDTFSVIFRVRAAEKWDEAVHPYKRCLALPFWSYIDAGGNVWGCSVYLKDERFLYGNIHEQTFQSIWESDRRKEHLRWVAEELDPACCRVNCRMDEVNRYLWDLMHPPAHVNFI